MKVYSAVASLFRASGATTVFGIMGDANMLYLADYIQQGQGTYVSCTIEGSAVSMADGYHRVSGEIGIASVTHGPGFSNCITSLVEAVRARSNVLVVTGSTPAGERHNQQVDIRALCAAIGADYVKVHNSGTALRELRCAINRFGTRRGPVVLDVPVGLLDEEVDGMLDGADRTPSTWVQTEPDPDGIEEALGIAISARRTVILAGRGAVDADAKTEIAALAHQLRARLMTTLLAKDYFRGDPLNLGFCGGLSTPEASDYLMNSDCVIVFGASLNDHTTMGWELLGRHQRIIQCDIDPLQIRAPKPITVGIVGDAKRVANAMLAQLAEFMEDSSENVPSRAENSGIHDSTKLAARTDAAGTVDLREALRMLDQFIPAKRNVVTDLGRFVYAPWQGLHVEDPRHFAHTSNFGSIGLGLPTAIGAAVSSPDRPTIAVVGDGGFMMHCQELHTAARLGLPLVVAVANDGVYGAEWRKLSWAGIDPNLSRNTWPDFVTFARALKVDAFRIQEYQDIEDLQARLASPEAPLLLDIALDPTRDPRYD